jgi:hypothetical protein
MVSIFLTVIGYSVFGLLMCFLAVLTSCFVRDWIADFLGRRQLRAANRTIGVESLRSELRSERGTIIAIYRFGWEPPKLLSTWWTTINVRENLRDLLEPSGRIEAFSTALISQFLSTETGSAVLVEGTVDEKMLGEAGPGRVLRVFASSSPIRVRSGDRFMLL